ncbi:uncharacterized protein B0T15DRAFT_147093 [Chaetomium strumarium]|uniref:RanBD1 domain-containing protein n=1 Tax=Chaetomium strumarium TaxID=1170767 RepID=A0AAJ0GUW6_9PEZI|nr:hypothetical protein B0T15DRAFT_147093 [Chaetomium strumarium]
MAEDPNNTSDMSDLTEPAVAAKEDAETTAARRELKQTTISEKDGPVQLSQDDKSASEDDAPQDKASARRITPDISFGPPQDEDMKEEVSSPKKKRARDELDENRDVAEAPLDGKTPGKSSATIAKSRTDRSEPEKKRPRDRQEQSGKEVVKAPAQPHHALDVNTQQEPLSASTSPRSSMELPSETKETTGTATAQTSEPARPSSAFATSGFAKLAASSISPFGSIGGAGKLSLFGSSGTSSFGSLLGGGSKPADPPAPPKLRFGSGAAASPFAGLNGQGGGSVFKSSPFASAFGGSAVPGSRLNFGKPGEALKSDKPARPFGAPESDAEDKSEGESNGDEDTKGDSASDDGENKEEDREKDESKAAGDDKKKPKLQKIVVDDGEGKELTLFSVRAKMYVMEKGVGWKERGAGMLKVNVPKSTVELDNQGVPDPASFDPSVLEDEEEGRKHVRLIMRQDHTLRVILNTVILPAMKFQVTNRLKASTILFTAFEGGEARQVQMKMSEVNATAFSQLVDLLKKRLADV